MPEVARLCVQRLVSAKSRLNFNEAVSAPLSLLQKFRFLAGDHYRRGLYSSVYAIITQEDRASGAAWTIRLAGRRFEQRPCHGEAGHRWPL